MSILRFPTMLRKMWSGSEVQDWLDANQELKELQAEVARLTIQRDSFLETMAKTCDLLGIDLKSAQNAQGKPSDVLYEHAKNLQQRLTIATELIQETMVGFEDSRFPGIRLMQRLRKFNSPACAVGEKS